MSDASDSNDIDDADREPDNLEGMLLMASTTGDGTIGTYDKLYTYPQVQGIANWLGHLGIKCELKQYELQTLGHAKDKGKKGGDVIIPASEISRYIEKGGIFFRQGALKGITFKMLSDKHTLQLEGPQVERVAQQCKEMGIRFERVGGALLISKDMSIIAVDRSGGRFNGAHDFLAEHGFLSRVTN